MTTRARPAPELREPRKLTQAELESEAVARFGPDPRWYTFGCPHCGALADAGDFLVAGADPNRLGQECIGRSLAERGCDWSAYGLFSGPWTITVPARDPATYAVLPDGPTKAVPGFALATTARDHERTDDERARVREAWDARRAEVGDPYDGHTTAPVTDGPTPA